MNITCDSMTFTHLT